MIQFNPIRRLSSIQFHGSFELLPPYKQKFMVPLAQSARGIRIELSRQIELCGRIELNCRTKLKCIIELITYHVVNK